MAVLYTWGLVQVVSTPTPGPYVALWGTSEKN